MDFLLNGQAQGSVATTLMQNGFDVNALRPWIADDGRHYVSRNERGALVAVPLMNATATLRKDEWIQLDTAVLKAAKERLRIVSDLKSAGLTFNIPNGMGKTVLETQAVSDITPATISMDPARKSESDRPHFDLTNLPLPVIHKDYDFNARQIAASRNGGSPLDTTMAELAGRRVAEEAEKLILGVSDNNSYSYGGGTIYGLTNYPYRGTKTLTDPTDTNWTPRVLVTEILSMRAASVAKFHYGPWVLYVSTGWDEYLDEDYSDAKGDNTLRERIQKINGITEIRTADYLTGMQMVLVQMTSDVIRLVEGMGITTVQWETNGGMTLHFKVMTIQVPQLRSDFNHKSGIIHGAVPE